mmetsp:Transcript_14800/g.32245  ORF Transcript_14800/g.32245 Transcript_14800/m.32245 type:complete len:210 (+) Transcript_14800:696-1325(+)
METRRRPMPPRILSLTYIRPPQTWASRSSSRRETRSCPPRPPTSSTNARQSTDTTTCIACSNLQLKDSIEPTSHPAGGTTSRSRWDRLPRGSSVTTSWNGPRRRCTPCWNFCIGETQNWRRRNRPTTRRRFRNDSEKSTPTAWRAIDSLGKSRGRATPKIRTFRRGWCTSLCKIAISSRYEPAILSSLRRTGPSSHTMAVTVGKSSSCS